MGKFLTWPPSLVKALVAGSTKAWEPMSLPKTNAALWNGAGLGPYSAQPTMAYAS